MTIFSQGGKIFTQNSTSTNSTFSLNVDGAIFWSDGERKNITSTTDGISVWKDNSGHMNNAIQNSFTNRPYYVENIINGQPALYFQTTKNLMIPNLNINNYTIFTVIKSNNNGLVYKFGTGTTSNETEFYLTGGLLYTIRTNKYVYVAPQVGGPSRPGGGLPPNGVSTNKNNTNNWISSDSSWKILTHQYNGTHLSHNLFINGTYIYLTTALWSGNNPGLLNSTNNLYLGSNYVGGDGMDGYIAEYIIYDSYLSNDDITNVNNYLNSKYQIY